MSSYSFLPGEISDALANAISWRYKRPIDKSQVVVEPHGTLAGQYVITVYDAPDLAKKIIPFMDEDGMIPIDIGELCPVGYKTNRSLYKMNPFRHGQIIGATESGKSSLLHVMMAHVTRCPGCFIWVGGTWKLYDFVGGWLEPYLDTGIKPPIERIAHGQQACCNILAAFLNMAAYRVDLRYHQRIGLPYGVLILDEVTYVAKDRGVWAIYNGQSLNASPLIRMNITGTAGAKQYLWTTAQRDTQDNLGDDGGTTTAQMGFSFVFYIKDPGTVQRVTQLSGLSTPRIKGECWYDDGMDGGVHKLRVPYPQSDDPLKKVLHNGPRVSEIAWRRRNISHELDAGSSAAADEYYPNRFPLVTEEYLGYLNNKPVSTAGSTSPGLLGANSGLAVDLANAQRDFDLMVDHEREKLGRGATGTDGVAAQLPIEVSSPVADMRQYRTLTGRIEDVCRASDVPLGRREIIDRIEASGFEIKNHNTVTNELGKMIRSDSPVLGRTEEDGKYYAL
jgi:hypothetical protein